MSQRSQVTDLKNQTVSSEVIPARPTAQPASRQQLALELNSSVWLQQFALELFSEKIQATSAKTLHGLGGDSETVCDLLATWCCPSDSERVALGLTIGETDCSCSPRLPTPTATDWKGGHDRHNEWNQFNLRDWWRQKTGRRYLPISVLTAVQGFPAMWMELGDLETQLFPKSPSGLENGL